MPRTRSKPTTKNSQQSEYAERDGISTTQRGDVLTLQEAADYLRVTEGDVLDLINLQALPGRKIGKEWRFLKTALRKWLGAPPGKKGIVSHFGAIKDDPNIEGFLKDVYEQRKATTPER